MATTTTPRKNTKAALEARALADRAHVHAAQAAITSAANAVKTQQPNAQLEAAIGQLREAYRQLTETLR